VSAVLMCPLVIPSKTETRSNRHAKAREIAAVAG
jgi:hypothetical protein